LLNAVDPMHDRQTKLEGYPDTCNSASLVQRVKQSFTIVAPTGTTAAGWDLQVINPPFVNTSTFYQVEAAYNSTFSKTLTSNVIVQNPSFTAIPFVYGGLSFIAAPSGSEFSLGGISNFAASNPTLAYIKSNPLPDIYSQGTCRIIANAFEISNTTAELTVQGSVLTYRQPIPDYETATTFNYAGIAGASTAGYYAAQSTLVLPSPPTTVGQSMLLPGSRQWKAKDGCYVVSAMSSDNIPTQDEIFTQPLLIQNPSVGSDPNLYSPIGVPSGANLAGPIPVFAGQDNFWTKFDQSGAYFTGLSPSTSLQVTWIVDVERFPTEQQADLVVVATPSPSYDPMAIQVYAHIMQDMPTGVTFAENGLGDWFMSAVGKVRDIVMPIIRPLAAANPKLGALVAVHDVITGGKKGRSKGRSKNVTSGLVGGAGAHFLNNGSNARDGMVKPLGKLKIKPQIKAHNKVARKNLEIYNHNLVAKKNLEIYNLEQSNKQARKNLAKYNASRGMRKRPPPIKTRLRG